MAQVNAKVNPSILRQVPELVSEEARLDPFPWFRTMRKTCPIRYDGMRQCWDFFGYQEVYQAVRDHAAFSSQRGPIGILSETLVNMDPPRHTKLRAIISKVFTSAACEALAPRIRQIVDELLAPGFEHGQMDFVRDFAMPRISSADQTFLGHSLAAGDWVMCWTASANRDDTQFKDADSLVLDRPSNHHLSFGHGRHSCLGAPLGWLEAQIDLTALTERNRRIRLTEGHSMKPFQSTMMHGLRSFPVTLEVR